MTKTEAHATLDKIRNGEFVPLLVTNQALRLTGDICGVFSQPLCLVSNEQGNDRPRQTHGKVAEVGFSYSRYLDCSTTESIK